MAFHFSLRLQTVKKQYLVLQLWRGMGWQYLVLLTLRNLPQMLQENVEIETEKVRTAWLLPHDLLSLGPFGACMPLLPSRLQYLRSWLLDLILLVQFSMTRLRFAY